MNEPSKPPTPAFDQPSLDRALARINLARAQGLSDSLDRAGLPTAIGTAVAAAATRLAVYGTLSPGRVNHHVLRPYRGTWAAGIVRGTLYDAGWGANSGAPALVWHESGSETTVHVLESAALSAGWARLDHFEGQDYLRILVPVRVQGDLRVANLYAMRAETLVRQEPS